MHLLLQMMMMMMWALMAMAAAQPRCDPQTQYEKNGQCCKMCGPGTRMLTNSDCLDPQCIECDDYEYQDKHTSEANCQRQKYCDPHKNFEVAVHESKKKKSICKCKEGFHCSSEACITCVSHTTCKPGYEAKIIGNHSHDTVCQKCDEGTFSNQNSWRSSCKKWTECKNGYHLQQSGTDTSDNLCDETRRRPVVVICLVSLVILILGALGLTCCIRNGKAAHAKGKMKDCMDSCLGEKKKQLKETKVLITNPTHPFEEESMLPEQQSSQEEGGAGAPEENEHQPSSAISAEASAVGYTDMGNFVTQENGKSLIISRQESQTQTFTD